MLFTENEKKSEKVYSLIGVDTLEQIIRHLNFSVFLKWK